MGKLDTLDLFFSKPKSTLPQASAVSNSKPRVARNPERDSSALFSVVVARGFFLGAGVADGPLAGMQQPRTVVLRVSVGFRART